MELQGLKSSWRFFYPSRLIGHLAGEERRAVVFQRDIQLLKPVRPLAAKMALDSDLIGHWLACFTIWAAFVQHFAILLPLFILQ